MATKKRGLLIVDIMGNINIDCDGYVQCVIEDGTIIKIPQNEINFLSDTIEVNVDGSEILIEVRTTVQEKENNVDKEQDKENSNEPIPILKEKTFFWNDAATKLFLDLYKQKKDCVNTRKIKTYKLMWKYIAEEMGQNGYSVSALQVENKFKTMERSYKNMISNNKKTGRGRKTCNFEAELTDLLGKKHSIQPLALSGRNGLLLRKQTFSDEGVNLDNNIREIVNDSDLAANGEIDNDPDAVDNNLASIGNSENLRRPASVPEKDKTRNGKTAEYLKQCIIAIDKHSSELKSERQCLKDIQLQILEEYRSIRKIHEDFIKSTQEQWAIKNAQRDERNKILKEIANRTNSNLL